MDPILHVRLLGDCCIANDESPVTGVNTPRLQSLLAYLLLHRDAPQSRSHVAFQFWPDSTETQAHSNLRTLLHRLRRALPDADRFLSVEGQTLQWRPDASYTLDVAGFEQAVARGEEAEQVGDEAASRAALEQAIDLYQGDLLPSCYDDWILPERERLYQAYLRTMEKLIQVLEAGREYDQAIGHAQRLLLHDPLHEAAYRRLMRLRALSGDRAGALRVYHTCATTLQRELGVEPSPATQRAYEQVLRVEARPEPVGWTSPAVSPLVGREIEWSELQTAWRRSARGPRFVLVMGEAGIGKTRLAEEMLHWMERQGIECAYARCYAAEGELAYSPVMALLRARSLPALGDVWLSEVARLLPELRAERPDLVPARPMTEPWQRQHLFEAIARAVLGDGQPLLLVIDDLHWCDRETLDWLHFLLRFDPGARLLVAGTCRPEELDEDCLFAATLPMLRHNVRLTEIELGPLDDKETASLASNVAKEELDSATMARLYRETEGNPLFVVETVRAVLRSADRRLLIGDGTPAVEDRGVPYPDLTSTIRSLPLRVQAVLETRLAQLSSPARELAGLAATIGRAFTFDLLRAAGDQGEDDLVCLLDELWQRRIVRERGAAAYDFAHDKLREAAYDALSPARRRLLHRRVAGALETLHDSEPDAIARRLAVHYDRAGLVEKAVPCYLRAGEADNRIYASEEAEASFRRGLALLEAEAWSPSQGAWRQEMAAGLYEGLGEVLKLDRVEEARQAYRNALRNIDQNDRLGRARLQRQLGLAWVEPGQFDQALQAFGTAETLLGTEPFQPMEEWWREWMELQNWRLFLYYCLGRWRDMAQLLDRMQPTVERHGTPLHRVFFLANSTLMAMRRDRYQISDETLATARAGLAAAQEWQEPYWLANQQYLLGWVMVLRGDLHAAEELLQSALALAEQIRHIWGQAVVLTWLTVLYRRRNQVEEVRCYSARGLAVAKVMNQPEQVAMALAGQAWVAWHEGHLEEAERLGQSALDTWRRGQFVYAMHWTALWPLLVVALERERVPEALDHARALLDPQQQRMPADLEASLEKACQMGDAGQPEAVRTQLQRTVELAKDLGFL